MAAAAIAAIAAALAIAAGAAGAGGTAAANKATGNKQAIEDLEKAQAAGRLTKTGEIIATTGQEQAKIANEEALRRIAAQQSAAGFTSGADAAVLSAADVQAQRAAAASASQAFAGEFSAQGQELEDRKQLRRARSMEIVNFISSGLSGGAQAFGAGAGFTAGGKEEPLDTEGADDETKAAFEESSDMLDDMDYTTMFGSG